jgi:hypothetical protein
MADSELVLLDKVLFRLAAAETDSALEDAVNKFLAPSLLKLSSPQEGVRKKVMELLVHVNKRIKGNDAIRLPMKALAEQYQVSFGFAMFQVQHAANRPNFSVAINAFITISGSGCGVVRDKLHSHLSEDGLSADGRGTEGRDPAAATGRA